VTSFLKPGELDVTGWRGQESITAAVAVSAPMLSALMAIGTEGSCRLVLDQGLQALAHQFRDEFAGSATAKQLLQLSGGRMRNGHGLVLRLEVVLKPGSQTGPPIDPQGI
jgi:hypothetical protein